MCKVADPGLPVARVGGCARAVALRVSARRELLAVHAVGGGCRAGTAAVGAGMAAAGNTMPRG